MSHSLRCPGGPLPELSHDDDLRRALLRARTIAVLGAHPDPSRPAHYVPAWMARAGYDVLPVNPAYAGAELFGRRVVASLGDLEGPVDMVDVFRRSDQIPAHAPEILALAPGCVWLQQGIRHDAAAAAWVAAGIDVVQDRCLMVEHRRLVGRP
ncbi:MAG TPA: CoA-binding protein [Myxococcota bacterium]|nr:CoA-binding protein [Myxococcota bacterium]